MGLCCGSFKRFHTSSHACFACFRFSRGTDSSPIGPALPQSPERRASLKRARFIRGSDLRSSPCFEVSSLKNKARYPDKGQGRHGDEIAAALQLAAKVSHRGSGTGNPRHWGPQGPAIGEQCGGCVAKHSALSAQHRVSPAAKAGVWSIDRIPAERLERHPSAAASTTATAATRVFFGHGRATGRLEVCVAAASL